MWGSLAVDRAVPRGVLAVVLVLLLLPTGAASSAATTADAPSENGTTTLEPGTNGTATQAVTENDTTTSNTTTTDTPVVAPETEPPADDPIERDRQETTGVGDTGFTSVLYVIFLIALIPVLIPVAAFWYVVLKFIKDGE